MNETISKLRRLEIRIFLRVALLFVVLLATAYAIVKREYYYLIILVPVIIFLFINLVRSQIKVQGEIGRFVEAVKYRDFSRHFDLKRSPVELSQLRGGFNQLNTAIRDISRDKETSYQYLQKILEMVDTGILSYDTESGDVFWMNDSLKKMLHLPYLKSIKSLKQRDETLYDEIWQLKPAQEKIITIDINNLASKILLSATAFQTGEKKFKLIAFQNINEALDETESKAWKKLLSVMTHEIMNSVAPISSLADTLKKRLEGKSAASENKESVMADLATGIETIRKRSEGLLKFAEIYRSLNKIKEPVLKKVLIRDLFEHLYQLMAPTLENKHIKMDIVLKDPGITVEADPNLIEQVLINLIINARDALRDVATDPQIILSAVANEAGKVEIKVSDNGCGITDEVLENIFVPFFSTKKSGSGIGLSLSKEIMKLHGGFINVYSVVGRGTAITLHFA